MANEQTGFIRPCRDCGEPSDPAMTMDFTDVEPGAFLHWCTACGEQAHTMNAILTEALAEDPTMATKLERAIEEAESGIQ